ncbi:unnamed protein product [Lathyrus oleraceus]
MYWLTAIYAHNQLENRKGLWTKLADIHKQQTGPWMLLGDYNNVLKSIDRIGGRKVTEVEHRDLTNLMEDAGLHEMDSRGQHFTWSNNQGENAIYSRIDRLLGNTDWFQQNMDCTLTVMHPSVSDHALLCLEKKREDRKGRKVNFKFTNCIADLDLFLENVNNSWKHPLYGSPMKIIWKKLQRLQPVIRNMAKPLADIKRKVTQARSDLEQAHMELNDSRMNPATINKVRQGKDELLGWQEVEESILRQRSKLKWL